MTKKLISGKTITNETIRLDEAEYINCTLENCTIIYCGGTWGLNENNLTNCKWRFEGDAKATIGFMAWLYSNPGLRPLVNQIYKVIEGPNGAGARKNKFYIEEMVGNKTARKTSGAVEDNEFYIGTMEGHDTGFDLGAGAKGNKFAIDNMSAKANSTSAATATLKDRFFALFGNGIFLIIVTSIAALGGAWLIFLVDLLNRNCVYSLESNAQLFTPLALILIYD